MADDINKKITIQVEAQTANLEHNIASLSKTIDGLLAQQKQLDAAGQLNSASFDAITSSLQSFQKKLQDVNTQLSANTTSVNALSAAGKTLDTALASSTGQHQKHAKAAGDSSAKTKELTGQINTLGQSLKQQKSNADQG